MLNLFWALGLVATPLPTWQSAPDEQTRWLVSTVHQSEFCPAGSLRLDLETGEFALTSIAPRQICDDPDLERPLERGVLEGEDLHRLRASFEAATEEGLQSSTCREGRKPDYIIVSNGGPRLLAITTGAYTDIAPEKLECWSTSAHALFDAIESVFPAP